MAQHEFGLLPAAPELSARYEEYEPWNYGCVAVDDREIERLLPGLQDMDCFWHTLEQPHKGLAYAGITLIPPDSLPLFLRAVHAVLREGPREPSPAREEFPGQASLNQSLTGQASGSRAPGGTGLRRLSALAARAAGEGKWMIHFGI